MMLFCCVGFAQDKEVMVVRQTDGKEVRYDVTKVERVYVETESPSPEVDYVDLGLRVKWATCNLGASKPEEYGDYYGWGCTVPYATGDDVNWTKYFQKLGSTGTDWSDCGTDKDPLKDYVYPNNKSIAGTKWDVARKKLGGTWRMPTHEEQQELMNADNCTWSWTTENGINGYKVTSKKNDNFIFLPAAGYRLGASLYHAGSHGNDWSSSPYLDVSDGAYFMSFDSSYFVWFIYGDRCFGHTVRPVLE